MGTRVVECAGFWNWRESGDIITFGFLSIVARMTAPIFGSEVPSWWDNVLTTIVGLLLSVTSRSKNRNAPSCPESLKMLAIVVDKAFLPDPARPWIHSILRWLLVSFAQSMTDFKISVLILGRQPTRLEASILAGSSLSRMSWPPVYYDKIVGTKTSFRLQWRLTEYNLISTSIIEDRVPSILQCSQHGRKSCQNDRGREARGCAHEAVMNGVSCWALHDKELVTSRRGLDRVNFGKNSKTVAMEQKEPAEV